MVVQQEGRDQAGRYLPGHGIPGPGVQSIYSEEIAETIREYIRNGTTVRYAVLAAGISHETYYNWLESRIPFRDSIVRAQAEWMATMSASVTQGAVGAAGYKGDGKLALMALERRDKPAWGQSLDLRRVDTDTLRQYIQGQQTDAITEDGQPAIVSGADDI